MKKLILTLTLAAFAVALQAGEGECPKSKAACAEKDKAACSATADKSKCSMKAAKAGCPAKAGCTKDVQAKKSLASPKAADTVAAK